MVLKKSADRNVKGLITPSRKTANIRVAFD